MLHPSSLIRLAVLGGVAFLVRAVVREAIDQRQEAAMLPPPRSASEDAADGGPRRAGRRRAAPGVNKEEA
jgi:hypothetical protein